MAVSPMAERSPQDQDKYIVRFPEGMRDRLKLEAAKNNRSLNAEIIARLEATFDSEEYARRYISDLMTSEFKKVSEPVDIRVSALEKTLAEVREQSEKAIAVYQRLINAMDEGILPTKRDRLNPKP